jgi:hypothetical protein
LLFKTLLESEFQTLFYEVIFLNSKSIIYLNPNSISFMQAGSPCFVHKTLWKNSICFENWFVYCLKLSVEY